MAQPLNLGKVPTDSMFFSVESYFKWSMLNYLTFFMVPYNRVPKLPQILGNYASTGLRSYRTMVS